MMQRIGIGIDLGGASLKYALGNNRGEILKEGKRPSHATEEPEIIIREISQAILELVSYAKTAGLKPSVIGMGTPGAVDIETGILKGSTPNFKYWRNVPIKNKLENKVKLPVFVDNDANMMAMGEAKYGAGIGHQNMICLTIGTGIGGGVIINGELFRGSHYSGAELGHTTIKYDGLKCRCGGKGCLERYASASAMIELYDKKLVTHSSSEKKEIIDVEYIFEQMRSGNPTAIEVIEQSTYFLGRGIASFINIFNPTIIIIGGGVAEAGEIYLKKVEEVAFKYAMDSTKENVKIVGAKLGNKAGCLGAMSFAFDQMTRKIKS